MKIQHYLQDPTKETVNLPIISEFLHKNATHKKAIIYLYDFYTLLLPIRG